MCHYEFISQTSGCKNIQIFVKCLSNNKKCHRLIVENKNKSYISTQYYLLHRVHIPHFSEGLLKTKQSPLQKFYSKLFFVLC